jgi:hypothetical protein
VKIHWWLICLFLCFSLGSGQSQADSAPSGYSAAGLYNLANSYARAGKPGMAILNYERAAVLAPNDADVAANLRFVRESVHLPVETPSRFSRIAGAVSPLWLSWIGVLGVALIGACLITARFSSRQRGVRILGMIVGVVLVGWLACNAVFLWPKLHEGIIITASTPARVSPVPMGDPLFALPEGETVRISAEHDGFTLIRTRAGRTGWVADSSLAPIVPRPKKD